MTAEATLQHAAFVRATLENELGAAARQFLEREAPLPVERPSHAADPDLWEQVATKQGWPGMLIAEEHGGLATGLAALCTVLEECGRVLLGLPVADTAVAAAVIEQLDAPGAADQLLSVLAAGEQTATIAFDAPIAARGRQDRELRGRVDGVVWGAQADLLLLPATAENGTLLLLLGPEELAGSTRRNLVTTDHTRPVAELHFEDVLVPAHSVVAEGTRAQQLIRWARAARATTLASENVGLAERCLGLAVEYANDREQFGRKVGSFQAVKHRLADVLVHVEQARTAARAAATAANDEFEWCAAVARSFCSDAAVHAAGDNIQVHGGVGFTTEHPAHLLYKRAAVDRTLVWSAPACREYIRSWLFEATTPDPQTSSVTRQVEGASQ